MFLVQHTWKRGKYRHEPRECVETALSVLMGAELTLEEASTYVNRGRAPTSRELA
jgi:hypothetical protein